MPLRIHETIQGLLEKFYKNYVEGLCESLWDRSTFH
jgi:hypothetical protein